MKKVPQEILGVSEPPPEWFGNPPNKRLDTWTNSNWLKSRFHFSFAEYSNPLNTNFGVLRVMNDDLVQPMRGFGEHPHRDVEICTYIVNGMLTHKDSMGTEESLGRGSVQFMTAGRGVAHSEHNLSPSDPLRFVQIWITTRQRGLSPNYGSSVGNYEERHNGWSHIVSDVKADHSTAVKINQDANIFVTELDPSSSIPLSVGKGRQAYLLCVEGGASISSGEEEILLKRHDAMEIASGVPVDLTITASSDEEMTTEMRPTSGAHLLMVEMAFASGSGRGDI